MSDELRKLVKELASMTGLSVAAVEAAVGVFEAPAGVWPGPPLPDAEIVRVLPMVVYRAHAIGMAPTVLAMAHRQKAGIGQAKEAA